MLQQRVDHGLRPYGRVDCRLEGEHRRETLDRLASGKRRDSPGQATRQALGLARGIETERRILVGIELLHDLLPRGPPEPWQRREPGPHPRDDGDLCNADRRRQQHEPGRPWQVRALDHRHRVVHGERGSVRIADHVDRPVRAHLPAQVTHRDAHRRLHVLDLEAHQARRRRAMPGQSQGHDLEPACGEMLADRAHAVGRIGQPVQQQRSAARVGGRQLEAAVPVGRPDAGIAQAAGGVAIDQRPLLRRHLVDDLGLELGEEAILERAIGGNRVHLPLPGGRELGGEVGRVPDLRFGPAAQEPDVGAEQDQCEAQQHGADGRGEQAEQRLDHDSRIPGPRPGAPAGS